MTNKIFAIGDIHGCYDKLTALMAKIDMDDQSDLLVFLGDYIDRGPDAYKVVEYLVRLQKRFRHIVFLKGNHEYMLEQYLSGSERYGYLVNGGQHTIDSYMKHQKSGRKFPIPEHHLAFFKALVLYYETDDFIFVHAGLREKIPLEQQDESDMLWIRDSFIASDYDFGKRVVFGHSPFKEPHIRHNMIGIDTGAVYGRKLTCIELTEMKIFQA